MGVLMGEVLSKDCESLDFGARLSSESIVSLREGVGRAFLFLL